MKLSFSINQKYLSIIATISVFVILYIVSCIVFEGFFSEMVFINFFIDNAFLGISAIGMTFVILSGGIDLSVGSVIAMTGVITATLVEQAHLDPLIVVPIALLSGSFLGLLMGCIIHFFDAPPFIVTLGGYFLARGIGQVISLESLPIYHPFFQFFIMEGIPIGDTVIIPYIVVIFLVLFVIAVYVAHYTRFGRNVYAIGGNIQSARLLGVPIGKTRVGVYTLNGFCSALAGIVYTMYTSGAWSLSGKGFELDVISAVVIGGTLLSGGVGFMAGTMFGVLISGIIQTFITFQGQLSSHWTRIVIGVLVFIFILLQRFFSSLPVSSKATRVTYASMREQAELTK
ncbi:MAG: sugar ABC transporter permease YjfF [Spirochaetales bacterium]|nr:sugar ABC transporter permease YjfF [Spirochaetales bacterium]